MPDKLKAHSNERIDLVDFILAANDYTSSTNAFDKERTWLDGRSRILEGFYVEISDQTTAPGQITIYNGTGLDRDGNILNDESLANSATTVTLAGASQSFYIEIELTSSDSSTDSRAFWDPTVTNTVPIPNGGEVNINVPTRITPNWQVVYPVSTSGFSVTTNPASTRVPIALLNTNGSNQITNAVNTYGSLVNASTKAETDVVVTAGSVRVIDSKLFAVGSQFTYDFGGANPEVTLTVTGNALDNNIISFTPGLSFAHNAGAILRQTGVTARFLPQITDPNDPTFSAALPTGRPNDQERRMFQGDETRGSAFLASKSTYGARNDLDIRTLKDEVDFLAAMVRDMKFGHPRVDVTSDAPPSSFSTRPRYFDDVGGIAGARTAYVTIGNGTTTFGDFNGTDHTPFVLAENSLPADGGTIYVKPGTYIFTSSWSVSKPNVNVVGDGRLSTIISPSSDFSAISVTGGIVFSMHNITMPVILGSIAVVFVSASTLFSNNCELDGVTGTAGAAIVADITNFNRPLTATSVEDCVFTRCNFTANSGVTGTFVNCLFDSCEWTCTATAMTINGVSSNVHISNSSFVNTTTDTTVFSATNEVTNLRISNSNFVGRNTGGTVSCVQATSNLYDAVFTGCTFTGSHTAITADSTIVSLTGGTKHCVFSDCLFSEATPGTGAIGLGLVSVAAKINVDNCSFEGCQKTGISASTSSTTDGFLNVSNCLFSCSNWGSYSGVYINNYATVTRVTGCKFNVFSGLGTPTQYAVRVLSASNVATVYVENNIFNFYITNGNARPVFISSSSINSFLGVTGNTFTTAGNSIGGTGTFNGVTVEGATCVVQRNTFRDIAASGTGTIACVYNNSNPSDVKLAVRDNTCYQLSTVNGTLRIVDVLYGNTDDSVVIENNTVHDVTTASSAPFGLFNITHTVSADATHKLVFSGNTITDCQLGTGGFCYAIRCFYGGATITNNTFSLLTAPGSTSLAAIGAGQCASLIVADNVVKGLSSTNNVHGISIFNGSPISVITGNKVSALTSTAAVAAGMSVGGVFTGECCSNDFSLLTGSTLTHSIVAAGFSSAVVANNSCSSIASGAVQEISANSCSNTVFSNNKLSHTSSTTAYGLAVTSSSIDGMSILGNVITGYRYPVYATTASSASITGNINISGNTIDSKTLLIPNFVGVYVGIDVSGLNGIFRGIAISNNIIRKSDSTSSSCIIVDSLGVASTTRVTGISVTNNQLFETGSNVTSTGYMIRLAGTVAGGVIAFQDVAVNNNNILCIGALGTRQPAVTFAGCTRATMNNNTVLWNSGAQDTLHFAVAFGICVGNMVESDTSTFTFNASGGSNTTLVGNQTNRTGAGVIQNAFTNPASNF